MMTTEQSLQFILEYIAAISKDKSEETLDQYITDPHLKGHVIVFETGLPGYQFIPQDIIAEKNKVTVLFIAEGEHKGELFGVAPTGRKVSVHGIIVYELENSKIVNHWMQADSVALMQQIGAMPVAADQHR